MARNSKKSNYLSSKNLILASAVVIFLIFALFLGTKQIGPKKTTDTCKYGFLPTESFLRSYTVKSQDTLLSIANNELGSTGRVNELISLNKEKYPYLSIKNNFLEVGYQLYLPPKNILNSSGDLFAINGKLISNTNSTWTVKVDEGLTYSIYPMENTIFESKNEEEFIPGDCVNIIGDNEGNRAFIITPQ
ncbi:MAG: hypothetical protein A2171_03045 [Candidatus Levybacteria bacterium RBG_13_35_9]|nr:MAG: hypothetical protein A2171_03045 [Candidatus Levybacteria bacterium RBG_13_35_9]